MTSGGWLAAITSSASVQTLPLQGRSTLTRNLPRSVAYAGFRQGPHAPHVTVRNNQRIHHVINVSQVVDKLVYGRDISQLAEDPVVAQLPVVTDKGIIVT